MRRVTAWIGGIASGVVAYRFWRRHQATEAAPEPEAPEAPAEPDARADELRAKLAETREPEPQPAAEAVVEESPAAEPEPEPESPDERRSRVHEEGRAALDDMKSE
jgi:hypothetical protein